MSDRQFRILGWILVAAVAGLGIFSFLVWRAVTVEPAEARAARAAFAAVREEQPDRPAMLISDDQGQIVSNPAGEARPGAGVTMLRVLAYRPGDKRLVRGEVPFWFFRLKGSVAQFALRDTGFDLERLGITPGDIRQHGPGIILDRTLDSGNGILVWGE